MRVRPYSLSAKLTLFAAFAVFAVAVSYCAALFYGITSTERELMSSTLAQELREAIYMGYEDGAMYRVYADGPDAGKFKPIPQWLEDSPAGFSEYLSPNDNGDAFVWRQMIHGTDWIILRDQTAFEHLEIEIYKHSLIGLGVATLIAALCGWLFSRLITRPIRRLADDMRRNANQNKFVPISASVAQDEIGSLARTCEQTLRSLHGAIDRERAFTADVSHELRTPLMVISSSLDVMRARTSDPAQLKQLDTIRRASLRLTNLVQVFLELARSQAGIPGGDDSTVGQCARVAVNHWLDKAQQKGLELNLQVEDEGPKSCGILTVSLIDNLVRNALQYTAKGSVTVTVNKNGLAVADTGRGIPDGEKKEVLERFVRGKNAPGEGYGLGLSLVRRICERNGWELSFEQRQPNGTIFRVQWQPQISLSRS